MNTLIVVMGVTGCGKSSVGSLIASRMAIPFFDADDFHPESNIRKMRAGNPLNDVDRQPWLERLARLLHEHTGNGCVLACSALKEKYRNILHINDDVRFVYLKAQKDLITQRVSSREGHFMPSVLVNSQFEALEEPVEAIAVDAGLPLNEIVSQVLDAMDS